jgi:hypothetical protein
MDPDDRGGAPNDREATVNAMARALRARKQRRRRTAWLGSFAAAAAGIGALVALHRAPRPVAASTPAAVQAPAVVANELSGGVLVLSKGSSRPVFDGMPLGEGDHLIALLDGRATIAQATGTRLSVEGGGDVALLSQGSTQLFSLGSGGVVAHVAKLHAGERFVIRTDDAEVEVRGTSFRVAIAAPDPRCGNGTITRVNVYEGVVTVRDAAGQTFVHPGESWPEGCGAAAPAPAGIPSSPGTTAEAPAHLPAARPPAPSSDLAVQNDLFEEAMDAKRRGDVRGAVAAFDRLLSRYPTCPFAESADVERMNLLADYDRVRAEEIAGGYLRRYPDGFGRAEAEALVR